MSFYIYETDYTKGVNNVGKVRLTQEQADAIEDEREGSNRECVLGSHVRGWEFARNQCLNALSVDEFARVLYEPNSYEVEPEYKVGDWVTYKGGKNFALGEFAVQVEGVNTESKCVLFDLDRVGLYSDIRHSHQEEIKAEKERRLWKSIGREVGKLKWDDVLVLNDGTVFRVLSDRCERYATSYIKQGAVVKFFPAESFISFEEGEGE